MGFSSDRFVEPPGEDFHCKVCNNILQQPKMIPECEHIFCGDCFETLASLGSVCDLPVSCPIDKQLFDVDTIREPFRFFLAIYDKLAIRCVYFEKCATSIPISELEKHEQECEHNPANIVVCPNICGIELKITEFEAHSCREYFHNQIDSLKKQILDQEEQSNENFQEIQSVIEELRDTLTYIVEELKVLKMKPEPMNGMYRPAVPPKPASTCYAQSESSSNRGQGFRGSMSNLSHVSNRSRASSRVRARSKISFDPKMMLSIFSEHLEKLVMFESVKQLIGFRKWSTDPLKKLLLQLTTFDNIRAIVNQENGVNVQACISHAQYNSLFDQKITFYDASLMLNMTVVQLLESQHLMRNKHFLLIGLTGSFIIPLFINNGNSALMLCSEDLKNQLNSRDVLKAEELRSKFLCHQTSLSKVIETLLSVRHKNFKEFDIIISFENIAVRNSQQILEHHCPQGFMLILEFNNQFEKRFLDSNGQQQCEVFATYQQIRLLWASFNSVHVDPRGRFTV